MWSGYLTTTSELAAVRQLLSELNKKISNVGFRLLILSIQIRVFTGLYMA